ncbi:MAG: hypothetical protein LBE64_22505 [Acinetobacter pittii]|nr:hypothetical protein [Acinetobacter pittii]
MARLQPRLYPAQRSDCSPANSVSLPIELTGSLRAADVIARDSTGERPHRCEVGDCDKAFSDSSSLARHRRVSWTGRSEFPFVDH